MLHVTVSATCCHQLSVINIPPIFHTLPPSSDFSLSLPWSALPLFFVYTLELLQHSSFQIFVLLLWHVRSIRFIEPWMQNAPLSTQPYDYTPHSHKSPSTFRNPYFVLLRPNLSHTRISQRSKQIYWEPSLHRTPTQTSFCVMDTLACREANATQSFVHGLFSIFFSVFLLEVFLSP